MKQKKSFLTHFMMALFTIVTQVSGLLKESIVGGYPTDIKSFKHLIEIRGKRNFSNEYEPICGGAMLSDFIAISAAHCFINEDGNLSQFTFSVKAATNLFNDSDALFVDVDLIYILSIYEAIYINDIALVKLKHEIGIRSNNNLSKLKLPKTKQSFSYHSGKIAGFGYHWVIFRENFTTGLKEKYDAGHFDNYLRYGFVTIQDYESYSNNVNLFLGKMISDENESWGTCTGDSGNVLVIHKTAIGILLASAIDCNDSNVGSIYLKISNYKKFIKGIITGVLTEETLTFENHPHVM